VTAGPEQLLGTAALIAALALDEVAVGQFMVSQPLVGGWILGYFLGDPAGGLAAGAFFQLLCLTELPVGASVPPDGALAGLVGVGAYLLLPRPPGWDAVAVLGLLAVGFLPLAYIARAADVGVRRANGVWARLAERLLARGRPGLAQLAALGGIPLFFARAFIVAGAALGLVAVWGGERLADAPSLARSMGVLGRVVPLFGIASLVAQRRRGRWVPLLACGAAAGAVIGMAIR